MNHIPNRRTVQQPARRQHPIANAIGTIVFYTIAYGVLVLVGVLIIAKLGEYAWEAVQSFIKVVAG